MKPLTPSAERVYEAVRVFIANTGRSPTYEEIYQGSGVDPSSITNALFRLEQHGKIVRPVKGFIAIPGQKLPDPPIHVKMGYERRTEKQKRPCLSCGNKFDSEWIGQRVCDSCKGTPAWKGSNASDYSAPGLRIA